MKLKIGKNEYSKDEGYFWDISLVNGVIVVRLSFLGKYTRIIYINKGVVEVIDDEAEEELELSHIS